MRSMCRNLFALTCCFLSISSSQAALPQAGDLVLGNNSDAAAMPIELAHGAAVMNGGMLVAGTPWVDPAFVQSIEFDNFGGIQHNASGNIVGLNFGPNDATGGAIYSYATTAEISAPQLLFDYSMGTTLNPSRLAGLSIAPDNSKMAMNSFGNGGIVVFDYTPGDTMASGGAVSGDRETFPGTVPLGLTAGTAWLDNNTVIAFGGDGSIVSVNATTMTPTFENQVVVPGGSSITTGIEYNPDISPYVFAAWSQFAGSTQNRLYVLDPANNFAVVPQAGTISSDYIDLSASSNTSREIAFDVDGNLYISAFSAAVDFIPNAAALAATGSLTDDSSVDWYTSATFSSFNGIDIALGGGTVVVDCDFNDNEVCNGDDIDMLMAAIASGANDPSFDINQDGFVNNVDRDDWLDEAGNMNIGAAYLLADFTLDGVVDGQDFIRWNLAKFTANTNWTDGNANGDGFVDGQDFIEWNDNKFMSSTDAVAVPEPAAIMLLSIGLLAFRRRK